jgi:energy-coupling factor transport system permease protein
MDQEIYLDRNTFFHRLDPRTKIFILASLLVMILYFQHPLWILPVSLFVFLHGLAAKSLANLRRIRYLLVILTVSSLVLWSLFARGQTHWFWIFDAESLIYGLGRTLVMISLIVEGMIFMSTTRNEEITQGLIGLGLPYRFGFAVSTALRMVPTIAASAFTIAQAQRSRGLDLDHGNVLERFRKYLPLLIPVFLSTIRNTHVWGMAIESRGFGARPRRTFYLEMKFRKADFLCMIVIAAALVGATACKILGYGEIPGLIRF